jgi:hypothetical protein
MSVFNFRVDAVLHFRDDICLHVCVDAFVLVAAVWVQDLQLADLAKHVAVPVGLQGTRLLPRDLVGVRDPALVGRVASLAAMLARGARSALAIALDLEALAFSLFAGSFSLSFFSLALALFS